MIDVSDEQIHKILDKCLKEGKVSKLFGQTSFIIHWRRGIVKQITDEKTKKTWIEPKE